MARLDGSLLALGAGLLAFTAVDAAAVPGATRPRGGYVPRSQSLPIPPNAMVFAPGGLPLPIYVNRNGGTFRAGVDNSATNTTSIVNSGSRTLAAFSGSNQDWAEVMNCVREQFAPFNVEVTDQEPTRVHLEAVVGGTPQQLGMPSGVGGVAPMDTYSCEIIENAIVFIFSEVWDGNNRDICETVAQEVAHAFSLDHEFLCEDPMTYLYGCGNKSFQDVNAQCGEDGPRACACNRTRQNSVQVMLEKLGPAQGATSSSSSGGTGDTTPPTVTVVSPMPNSLALENAPLTVEIGSADNVGVTTLELVWEQTGNVFSCPTGRADVTCTRSGNNATWVIPVGTGTRRFRGRARDAAGNTGESTTVQVTLGAAPADTTAPVVDILRPGAGDTLDVGEVLEVAARVTDNVGVETAELRLGVQTLPCPSTTAGATCSVEGSAYIWRVTTTTAQTLSVRVRAVDAAGNEQLTAAVQVTVQAVTGGSTSGSTSSSSSGGTGGTSTSGGTPPPAGGGSTSSSGGGVPPDGTATPQQMFCGQTASLAANAVTTYTVGGVRAKDYLVAEATTLDVDLEWLLPTGMPVGDTAQTQSSVVARAQDVPEGEMLVRVTPRVMGAPYDLSIRCAPVQEDAAGCSQAGGGYPWLLWGVLALLLRRQGGGRG